MGERQKNQQYFRELGGAIGLYALVLIGALQFGPTLAPGLLQTAVLLSPALPLMLAIWAVVRQVHRVDEFIRKTTLEQLAIAAAITAGWTFTYGFLENAGFPRLSMFTVWPVMGAAWGALSLLDGLRHR